jgi:hypothetical protein
LQKMKEIGLPLDAPKLSIAFPIPRATESAMVPSDESFLACFLGERDRCLPQLPRARAA